MKVEILKSINRKDRKVIRTKIAKQINFHLVTFVFPSCHKIFFLYAITPLRLCAIL